MEGENAFVLVNDPPPNPSGTRRVMSEVRVEANRERVEGQRGRSHATRDVIDAEALRRSRKIERLERELRELKEVQASCDQQRSRRQRSRSHSDSCESSHRCPKRSEEDHRAPKNSRRSKTGRRTERKSPVHKPEKKDQNPVWNQLRQISHSPFSSRIERAKLPARIAPLNLITYNGKTDPVAHLSHYRRSMALHNGDDILMCRIFPSSLGDVALRWFDRLEHGSIHSWTELSEAFTTRFITNTRKPKEVDSLMALAMRSGESLKSYSARYWETYNEIDRCGEDVAISQFRFGLPVGSKLRQSLAKKPPPDMSNLMSRIEQHVRVEEDGLQPQKQSGDNVVVQKKSAQPETSRAQRNPKQSGPVTRESFQAINTTFKEPIFKILPQIKNKPYFVWPARLGGDPASRESMPYCAYHREKGHLTETCRNYKALLEELVRDGHLHQFVDSAKHQQQRVHDPKPKAPIGTIEVIHSHARADNLRTETRAAAHLREIFQVSEGVTPAPKRLRKEMTEEIIFTDRDLEGVQLPHSDALVVTMQIGDFEVKRILIDPGSSAEIMYDSLFKGLGLEHKDLDRKVDPLYGFSGESVMPVGRVTVKVHAGTVSSPTDFWVLNSYSPYNAILGRPWLHKMKAVPSTLHQRLRFPTPEGIMEVRAPGVDPAFACHSLNVDPLIRPVVQKGRRISPLHQEAVCEEVNRLVEAKAIREILYPTWLSNTVVVKKKNGKWRVMPFGLKNAGATYQRMITKMFSSQLGKTVEVYIDDMVVKSVYAEEHVGDLRAVFNTLRRHHLKLNASKCAFGVGSGKFLGFMVTQRGIEANPDQISAILELRPPRTVREVQKLTGMAAALNRFISRAAEKCRPFFDLIKKGKNFHLGKQSDQAFERLKEYLATAPLLSTPVNGESLYVNLADSEHAVSAAIVREDYNIQKPVYYTSKTLDGAESRYLPLEKLAFALVCSAKKLPHYFQAHTMIVLTEQPLKAVLRSADFSGRISKWGAQLGAYDINYRPRTSIKGQVLADFIAEFTPAEMGPMWVNHVSSIQHMEGWKLYIDGASNSRGSGLGVVLTAPQGQMMELAIRLGFPASNNVAEYEALLHGLQISRDYAAKDEKMKIYLVEAKKLLEKFKHVQVEHIGRDLNGHADALAGLASAVAPELRRIISVGVQSLPSVEGDTINEVCSVDQSPSWMSPILAYLKDDILPADRKEADRIRRIAPRYWVSKEGNLYRRSFTGPYLRCVHPDTVQNLLWEIHEGVCGGHTGGRSLAHRAIGQGYWWPYMQKDAAQYVKKCDKCQRFAPSIHQPAASLNPIASPWPFSQWGLDIVGPLPRAPGNRQWLIVATDYFTKWVEAELLVHITDADSKRFVWKNMTRFGIPRVLVSDNGSQFTSGPFREFCEQYGIRNHFSTPAYPQANGQAESSNKTLLDGIKKRLEKAKGRWVEELPNILWTYRTTPRCSTGETPFSLTYGVEAVIPLEIGLPTIRTEYYDPVTNETSLATDLDLAEERRDSALIHLAAYQNGLRRIYEKRINPRELAVGDLVLRKVMGAKQDPTHGKLGPNWEGPYKIASVAGTGAFMLIGPNDTPVKRPWNICNLKKYYQ
uniref:Integrase catalytic domain-containing protein n=1 Tax=Fagus sylvatica TaxID=28930 RepID=A0A2N9J681_FAGSY